MDFCDNSNVKASEEQLSISNSEKFLRHTVTLSLSELKDNQRRVKNAVSNTDIGMISPSPVSSFTELEKAQIQERFDTLRLCVLDIQGFLQEDKTSEEWEAKKANIRYLLDK